MSKLILALAATLAAGFTAAPVQAAPRPPDVRIVSTAGFDLASPAGRARLDRRIAAAVRAVCGQASPADLRGRANIRACRADSFARLAAAGRGRLPLSDHRSQVAPTGAAPCLAPPHFFVGRSRAAFRRLSG